MWPPPEVKVSAAKKDDKKKDEAAGSAGDGKAGEEAKPGLWEATDKDTGTVRSLLIKAFLGVAAVGLIVAAPEAMVGHFFVFILACVIGFYVITNVTHTLHTPLMSVTNAISGIIIVGAILQIVESQNIAVLIMSTIAIAIASINIFGGFLVTHRMLKMFERSSK